MIATLSALAEPNRLRIVELLRAGPRPVGDIGVRLGLRQPQVSKHLSVLRDAGLVDVKALAQERHYQLCPGPFRQLQDWLEEYRQLWEERHEGIDSVLADLAREERDERRERKPTKEKTPHVHKPK